MYLTIKQSPKSKKLTFEELLLNPTAVSNVIRFPKTKNVTIEITEEYGEKLFNKINYISIPKYPQSMTTEEINKSYSTFFIPKKTNPNKMRRIDAPSSELKSIQNYYKTYIENILNVLPHKNAAAYVKEKSIVDAMKKHQDNESRWYLQIDLKDFFPSINREYLSKMLKMVFPFKYIEEEIFEDIIKYSLLNDSLPQGSVLSPLLTNLIMVPIDHKLTELLQNYNKHHFVYTRYADDITISCKENFNPNKIIKEIKTVFKLFDCPFYINDEKTRYGSRAGKNYHLGIIINKDNKLSIGHEKNQQFRAMLFNFIKNYESWSAKDVQKMLGLISYYSSIEKDYIDKTIKKYNQKFNTDIIALAKSKLYSFNQCCDIPIPSYGE